MTNQRLKLLIVDDEPAHVEAIRRAYAEAGAGVELQSVGSLCEFRTSVQGRPPDLVLMDLNLPDGRALEALTAPPEDAPFPILVMTAFGNQQLVVEVLKAGALDYVVKSPASFATLPRTVERALRAWALLQKNKRAESALRESEARHRTILQTAMDGFWRADMQGRLLEVNAAYCRMTGHSEHELLTMHIADLEVCESAEAIAAHTRQIKEQGEDRFETRHRRKDGSLLDVEVSAQYRAAEGMLVAFIHDISARKQAAAEQARLAMAVEQAAETIMITDPGGTIVYTNPAFEKITGYSRAEVLGQNPRVLKSGQHDAAFYRTMWATLSAGQVWTGHLINKRKNGQLYTEEATISPVFDAEGKLVNYVAVKRDMTHEVALEAQNRQAAKLEAVGRLAGGVAHDFNNQLQIILGCTELVLASLPPDHRGRPDLSDIRTAARHSAALTHQLLAFSRKQAIAPVVLDLNEAIAGSLKMLGRLIGENVRLNLVIAQEAQHVFMDPAQLDQVLANLAVNARDAIAGTGSISLEVTSRTLVAADCRDQPDFVEPGDYVVLTCRDTGAGMTPEVQAHIFEPFFTTKGLGQGTGRGLATVYGILKQNHGAITVQSAPGQGTTFSLYLPRVSLAAHADTLETEAPPPAGTETVLVVEDEPAVLMMVQRVLESLGYRVLPAATPRLALQLCQAHPEPIHLLLTDVIMPDLSGMEVAERIRILRPTIQVLFMSGYTADIMSRQGHLPEGLHVLPKPFTAVTLARSVRAALDTSPARLITNLGGQRY